MKIAVALSVAAGLLGMSACKKSAPPVDQSIPAVDAAPPVDPMGAGAKEDFGKKFSCPDDRVTVTARADIDPTHALASDSELTPNNPSDEVKNDPGRYAKWKKDENAQRESTRAMYSLNTMFEVTGCGHKLVFGCHPHRRGTAVYPNWADCSPAKNLPDGETQDLGAVSHKVDKVKVTISLATPGAKVFLVSGADRRELTILPISVEIDRAGDWTLLGTKPGYSDYTQHLGLDDGAAQKSFVVALRPALDKQ